MSTLYDIDRAIMECVDAETGELIDPEKLSALMMERSEKIESVALWVKNLRSDALAYKAEKEAFADREKAASHKADQLEEWLKDACAGNAFKSVRCTVSFRKSEQVHIPDESCVPAEYKKATTTYKPDKKAIKAALKSGLEVAGCALVDNLNISIK